MALYGYEAYTPPRHDPNDGYGLYGPQAPGTTGPRYRGQRKKFTRPRPKAPVRKKVFDPFAPISDADLRARAMSMTNEQLGPILENIRRLYAERSAQGQAAIRGTTSALGNLFAQAAPQTAAAYGEATKSVNATNSELANRLGAFGQNLGAEVGGKLAAINAPAAVQSEIGGGAQQTAQGVANANFAIGAAEGNRLAAEGAHAGEYAAKLPGIAGLTGMQHARELEAQLNRQLQDDLAEQSSHASETFTNLYLHLVDQEWQKTLARTSGQFKSAQAAADAQYHAQQIAFKRAELAWKKAKAKADRAQKETDAKRRAGISQQNADTSAKAAQESARHNKASEAQAAANERGRNQRNKNKGGKKGGYSLIPPKKKH